MLSSLCPVRQAYLTAWALCSIPARLHAVLCFNNNPGEGLIDAQSRLFNPKMPLGSISFELGLQLVQFLNTSSRVTASVQVRGMGVAVEVVRTAQVTAGVKWLLWQFVLSACLCSGMCGGLGAGERGACFAVDCTACIRWDGQGCEYR